MERQPKFSAGTRVRPINEGPLMAIIEPEMKRNVPLIGSKIFTGRYLCKWSVAGIFSQGYFNEESIEEDDDGYPLPD